MFKNIGENPKSCGAHSLRAGGKATAANAATSERLFKWHTNDGNLIEQEMDILKII